MFPLDQRVVTLNARQQARGFLGLGPEEIILEEVTGMRGLSRKSRKKITEALTGL
jgi:hypothetical protein